MLESVEELKSDGLDEAYSYGEAKNSYNQFTRYGYNNEDSSWYIEYELKHSVKYYLTLCFCT
ncbi:hypothetical protein [Romboutsia sp.]|uniref:hypothetical protein n=1 Tax=Romboutsia sp. TaxID=1965302 RepID=UPI003F3216FF